jgi:hypothetical protein
MTRHGGRTNANRAHHSHNPDNHLGPTTPASLVEQPQTWATLATMSLSSSKTRLLCLFMNERRSSKCAVPHFGWQQASSCS